MSKLDALDLRHHVVYDLRIGRADRDGVDWSPWGRATLFIQYEKTGEVLCVTPNLPDGMGWAEYSPSHHYDERSGIWETEGYYMQIKGTP